MRALILIAGTLALAACGNNDQADNTQNIDENLTAENIVSNDITAIDAVTGDAANMAAESNIGETPEENVGNAGNMSAETKPKPKRPVATATPDEPTANTAAATGNSTD